MVCDHAGKVLKDTPNMLEVLKQADVVDAGGQGLLIIFEAMKSYMSGDKPDIDQIMNKPGQSTEGLNIKEFDIHRGACYVFEGRMGAGKTIFLETLYKRKKTQRGKIKFEEKK